MNAILAALSLLVCACVVMFVPTYGASAVAVCALLSVVVGLVITRLETEKEFLLQVFVAALLVRIVVGTSIFTLNLQEFFGGDAFTYDYLGAMQVKVWEGELHYSMFQSIMGPFLTRNWGMLYVVGGIYAVIGKNMLAVQFVNAVFGAATAPVIFLCARHIFRNSRVARLSTFFVAFYPSLVLWSSQGLKDGLLVFLLALSMLATLKLGEKLSIKNFVVLVASLLGIMSLRFYIFYMVVVAAGGAFLIGMKTLTATSLARQFIVIVAVGLALTYMGILRSAGSQLEIYGNLEALQRSRADLANSAQSGFGKDVDVSTTSGALSAIPIGMIYLLFAPFPWQLASLRQSITLPEMLLWWASFPLLVMGLWFTLKYRLRQALPILVFTSMLTLAYSVFQGNVGTAYRQRSQLLVFYFMFVSVGYVLIKERREDNRQKAATTKMQEVQQVAQHRRVAAQAQESREQSALVKRQQRELEAVRALKVGEQPTVKEEWTLEIRRRTEQPRLVHLHEELRAELRACFMTHPAATEADFERCWPSLRDEVFKQHAFRVLAASSPRMRYLLPANGTKGTNGNGANGNGNRLAGAEGVRALVAPDNDSSSKG
ncbi:MAG TPA: glycosyltransferase family 39 protein [Pyrinomonadaceae bacterium]|jgi:hypothetical protein